MRENRSYGSEGGEPQINAAFLPLSLPLRGWAQKKPACIFASGLVVVEKSGNTYFRTDGHFDRSGRISIFEKILHRGSRFRVQNLI